WTARRFGVPPGLQSRGMQSVHRQCTLGDVSRGMLPANHNFARFPRTGGCPALGFLSEIIEKLLHTLPTTFEPVAIQVAWNRQRRADNRPAARERPRHGKSVPTIYTPRPIVTKTHHNKRQLQPRRQVNGPLGQMTPRAARAVRRHRKMLILASI